ncbi:glycosyltransferase family 4 protein [Alloacidobacterium dinghuense]|uniref:Glycosyltransferase family 4 protein n=1 Tax=Alloacidobacterium dinghuense TaxID=2763107 RepID=A0A7G8BCJ8_9BACT|nr:glycosyltransferase family 4 protein [Alloacidobacterium dinghuense]QNI30268.1 glycosyltransferase family 4 protein [Alloacidobacterium dinghuense]
MRIFVNEFCGHPFQIQLSRELVIRGHEVEHVYFSGNLSTPKGAVEAANTAHRLNISGLNIKRAFEKHSIRSRRAADIEYGMAVAEAVSRFKPDVVISANMPLDAQKILLKAARKHNAKFIYWLQDVYSMAVRFVLARRQKILANIGGAYYESLEKKLLRQSDSIVCISDSFVDYVKDWGIEEEKIHLIENWSPLDEITPMSKDNPWARENGVAQKFCFMYSGTLGMKHRPELLLCLAKHLDATREAILIVNAAGAGADWLRDQTKDISPEAFRLHPFQPYERLSEVMATADVLIALLDSDAGKFAVPSKTLAYLCAARPILMAAPNVNQAAKVIQAAKAGLLVSPDSPEDFVFAARKFIDNPHERAAYAKQARAYAERNFNIGHIADRFLNLIRHDRCGQTARLFPRDCELD